MRRLALLAAAIALVATAAPADDAATGSRFAVQPSDDGFVRLDTETGTVSHCGRKDGVWFCEPVIEDLSPLRRRVEELAGRVDALAAELAALKAAPPVPAPGPVVTPEKPAPGFAETVVRRFVRLVQNMKRSVAGG